MTADPGQLRLVEPSPNGHHPAARPQRRRPGWAAVRPPRLLRGLPATGLGLLRGLPASGLGLVRGLPASGLELARIGLGRSQVAPDKGDKRFTDPAWQQNRLYRAIMQTYLHLGSQAEGLADHLGVEGMNAERARPSTSSPGTRTRPGWRPPSTTRYSTWWPATSWCTRAP